MFQFKHISKLAITVCTVLFVLGIVAGWFVYQSRIPVRTLHVAGSNAILIHSYIALACSLALAISMFYHRFAPKTPYSIWAAPFTKTALQRLKNVIFMRDGINRYSIIRATIVAFLTIICLYYFFRAGMQLLAARDPNFTVNAWGGPGYLGASFAHWMDAAALFYAQSFIIYLLIKPKRVKKVKQRTKHKKRS